MNIEHNCFDILEPFDAEEIVQLFDSGWNVDAKGDQIRLNGLAMLLTILEENEVAEENSSLAVPLLCKMQALSAAYQLGMNAATVCQVI